MLRPRTLTPSVALCAIVLALTGFSDLSAAASSCTYDPSTKTVVAALDPGSSAELEVGVSGEIRFGAPPSPCGAATTGNTDTILVTGAAGSTERLVLDQLAGPLAPGATPEASGLSEIEVSLELGDSSDEVVVQGSPDQEPLAVGTKGVAFNDDSDVDITFSPLPASIELVEAGGGPHVLSARGGFGSGNVFPGPVTLRAGNLGDFLTGSDFADRLFGGNGADLVHGSDGDDVIDGGGGNDRLRGAGGNDSLSGGPGADIFSGSYGDDVLDAHDGVADVQLNGGPGADTALFDRGLDPRTFAVETRVPLDPPPPVTPVTDCDFAAGVVSATMAPSAEATLEVRGGAIRFGAPEEDCGAATTTNTERITVTGASGSRETLVINLRGGRLGPGIPSEADRSEIEVEVNLEDPGDVVRVIGPHTRASFAVGSQGLALNADGDVDVIVDPVPVSISLVGGRGRDRLTAAGGHGAGGRFSGRAELRGAGAADILVGGNGRDRLYGGSGADHLVGAGRADVFSGGGGDDILRAVDLLRDRSVAGDAGRDTVFFDRGLDRPVHCELLRPRSG